MSPLTFPSPVSHLVCGQHSGICSQQVLPISCSFPEPEMLLVSPRAMCSEVTICWQGMLSLLGTPVGSSNVFYSASRSP